MITTLTSILALAAAATLSNGSVLPPGGTLTFAALNSQTMKWSAPGPQELDFYRDQEQILARFVFQSNLQSAYNWRWQVATHPFPAEASTSVPGLVAQGPAPSKTFAIDLTSFPPLGVAKVKGLKSTKSVERRAARSERSFSRATRPVSGFYFTRDTADQPVDLFVRLIAMKNNKPAGLVSNTVVAHFKPGTSPVAKSVAASFELAAKLKQMQEAAQMFQVAVTSFTPVRFPRDLGCVIIVYNPHQGKKNDVYAGYQKDQKVCPPDDPSKKGKDKGFFDYFIEGLEGYAFAWDKLVEFYDDAKAVVVDKFVSFLPCEALGKKGGAVCEKALEKLGQGALTVGLAAAGVPPNLPDVAALTEMGKGKIVDAATDFTCERIEDSGGVCTDEMRAKLVQLYRSGLEQMQKEIMKQATEPECGQSLILKELGKIPLPCFGDQGIKVKAAPTSVYQPPLVTLEVKRIKPQPAFPTGCIISTSLMLENDFPGGYLGGVNTPAKHIKGEPFYPASSPPPALQVGESKTITLALTTQKAFSVAANSWTTNGVYAEWLALYLNGNGLLTTDSRTTEMTLNGVPVSGSCSETVVTPVATPNT